MINNDTSPELLAETLIEMGRINNNLKSDVRGAESLRESAERERDNLSAELKKAYERSRELEKKLADHGAALEKIRTEIKLVTHSRDEITRCLNDERQETAKNWNAVRDFIRTLTYQNRRPFHYGTRVRILNFIDKISTPF